MTMPSMNELLLLLLGALTAYAVLATLWRAVGNRRLRAEARGWLETEDWAAFEARYDSATPAQRVVLLGAGQGHLELAMLYAHALRGPWTQAAAAADALSGAEVLPPVVEAAAREQLGRGGLRGDLLRALRPSALAHGGADAGATASGAGR